MNEKQAKRLRRAQRAHVTEHAPKLERGPSASSGALTLGREVRRGLRLHLNHRLVGRVGAHLRAGRLLTAANLCTQE